MFLTLVSLSTLDSKSDDLIVTSLLLTNFPNQDYLKNDSMARQPQKRHLSKTLKKTLAATNPTFYNYENRATY